MNEQTQKKLTLILGGVIAAVVVLGALAFFNVIKLPGFVRRPAEVEDTRPTARNAYEIALADAQKWQPDAKLAFMNSGPVGESGRSSLWKMVFISSRARGKGYAVEVVDYKVVSAQEIPYSGTGAELPADIISPEEAIASVRQIKGYENVEILGVEAVYGPAGKVWYWGVRTPKGVVSVEARKK